MTISQFRPKLLVIDDQMINVKIIHELFCSDFDVFMATSGEEALLQCKSVLPDVILLDIVMDGMDGFEVCRKLKSESELNHIPVIFITGQFNEQDEVKGFEVGAVDFIHKPINPIIVKARVATQLKIKQQTDILRNIAMLDGLTGIANRRHFDLELHKMWRHSLREGNCISLVIIDVDYFKQYNDHYGHASGDAALRSIAQCLQDSIYRPQDLVARVGGEEFAILLPETPVDSVVVVVERLAMQVKNLNIRHERSPIGTLSVSVGYSGLIPQNDSNQKTLYEQADSALYAAKKSGRNQAKRFSSEMEENE